MVAHARPSFSSPGGTLRRVKSIRILLHLTPFHPFMQLDLLCFALVSKKGVKGILGTPEWIAYYNETDCAQRLSCDKFGSHNCLTGFMEDCWHMTRSVMLVVELTSLFPLWRISSWISIQHLPPFPQKKMSCSKPFFIDPYILVSHHLVSWVPRVSCFACAPDMRHWNIVEAG